MSDSSSDSGSRPDPSDSSSDSGSRPDPSDRRLLASTGALFARPLDWTLGVIAEAGYAGAELMVTQDPATQEADEVMKAVAAEGVPIPAVHGPFLLLTRRVFGADLIEKARRSLELAAGVGAAVMVVHPPFRWQSAFHNWLLEEGDGAAAELGTRIGVENLFPVPVMGRHVRFHRYTEPSHLEPFRDLVLDTSHFGVTGVDICDVWERLGAQAAHLHVSDNRGNGRDSHAPLGSGVLPLGSFLRRVATSGYEGAITLEIDCRRYMDDRTALVGYLRQEREKAEALLAGAPAEEVLGRADRVASTPDGSQDDAEGLADRPGTTSEGSPEGSGEGG